jgi:SAM-dependent methyltransferase
MPSAHQPATASTVAPRRRRRPHAGPPDLVTASTTGGRGVDAKLVSKMLRRVVGRRSWSLHRHVHLIAAFEEAKRRHPITSMLSLGCGAGASELFIAATNPDVHVTLTDFDMTRMEHAQKAVRILEIDNVDFDFVDLLSPRTLPRADFVSSIEVLEHIEDDAAATASLLDHTNRFAYILVPYCSEAQAERADLQEKAWTRHEHHRVGYTQRSFDALLEGTTPLFVRNAYFAPDAQTLRSRIQAMSVEEVEARRLELVTAATADVVDLRVEGGTEEAEAIQALVEVRP